MLLILANTVVMASDKYNQSPEREGYLELLNGIFSILFGVELLLKVAGWGWQFYIAQGWN